MEEMVNQTSQTSMPMAVGHEADVVGHLHGQHAAHHFRHAAEGLIVDEQGVQVRLAVQDGFVDLLLERPGHQPHDGILGVGHLGEGVVHFQGLMPVPQLLRDGVAQQRFKLRIAHILHRAEAVAGESLIGIGVGGVGAFYFDFAFQLDVLAGRADENVIFSALDFKGVGLDVVKSKIEALSGEVSVKSVLGEGTTFIVRLPLTLAIIQALMVEVGKEKYALPLSSIVTVEEIAHEDIKFVSNKEVINLRDQVIPIVRLDEVLDVDTSAVDENDPNDLSDSDSLEVVIVRKGDKQAGLVITKLLGQQEIVIKPLGKYIKVPKMISGATILGNGEVALIIDSNTMV